MNEQPSFPIPPGAEGEETGRYVVTFRDDAQTEGLAVLKNQTGIAQLPSAADYTESALDLGQVDAAGGAVFPTLGVAVVTMADEALSSVASARGEDSAILDIEPERIFYALGDGSLPLTYLRGYRDAVNHLFDKTDLGVAEEEAVVEAADLFLDDERSTWGLKATNVVNSRWTGRGFRVAVLDTGLDLQHPDFRGRVITSRSFVSGELVQDRHGHGTHCIGTACGLFDVNGRRYGVAREAHIFAGKVLGNSGSGPTTGILAGMEWAVNNRCQVISMSLGNTISSPSTAYENAGRRALQNGCLIVAAAGNHGPGTVGQPANAASIMAVAAVDNRLRVPNFSARSGSGGGANVDIAGPGVAVYSSVPMPRRYDSFNGTSMATPHVAGIAALYAQAFGTQGVQLYQHLVSRARRLSIPASSVGAGLVQAPQ